MGNVMVDISAIVKNIGKDISFLQPVYEAVVNSLEANATEIEIEFFKDDQNILNEEFDAKINSFIITDNGEGFTTENIESFKKLWTTHKIALGCKGSGRFTWLNVFEKITIQSFIKGTDEIVNIPFSLNFSNDDITVSKSQQKIFETKTIIKFENITNKIFNDYSDKKHRVDKRELANLEVIYEKILNNLMIKLLLMKNENKSFKIELKLDDKSKIITESSIPPIDSIEFSIPTEFQNRPQIDFQLYYFFEKNNKKSKKVHYCANERIVETLDDDSLGFSASLPNNDSFTMLLCSDYFNENIGDSRNSLVGLKGLKSASFDRPLLLTTITSYTKKIMNNIILEKYPNLVQINKDIKEKAINKQPYLSKYIKEDDDILVSEKSLIINAKKYFNDKKEKVHKKFIQMLSNAEVNSDEFDASINEISEIALAELGEYIQYRKTIIDALEKSLLDKQKKEDFIHNIFMPMGITSKSSSDYLLNNLWLLDDKFMTYSYAASNVTIKKIVDEIEEKDKKKFQDAKRPDLTIFYNRETNKDLVVLEIKGANASLGEKENSIGEIARNTFILKKNINDINSIWNYILTTIDEEFESSLKGSEFKPLFSNDSDAKIYYRYYGEPNNAHVFAVDIKAIISDSYARNQTFLNILKTQ